MHIKIWFLLGLLSWTTLLAQERDSVLSPQDIERPTFQADVGDPPQTIELLFNRSFLVGANRIDTVPLNTFNSGSYSLGLSFRIPLANNLVGFRLAPSISWLRLVYNQSANKTFPTLADTLGPPLDRERHQLTALDLPVSFYYNITRDEDRDPRFFLEVGGYVGYLIGANYKQRYDDSDIRVTNRLGQLQRLEGQFERLRYGLFGRVGFKWISLYANYRLTRVFGEFTHPELRPRASDSFRNPEIPPLELGVSILL